jgi:hypothetical protein
MLIWFGLDRLFGKEQSLRSRSSTNCFWLFSNDSNGELGIDSGQFSFVELVRSGNVPEKKIKSHLFRESLSFQCFSLKKSNDQSSIIFFIILTVYQGRDISLCEYIIFFIFVDKKKYILWICVTSLNSVAFVRQITGNYEKVSRGPHRKRDFFNLCDVLAVAVLLRPNLIKVHFFSILQSEDINISFVLTTKNSTMWHLCLQLLC